MQAEETMVEETMTEETMAEETMAEETSWFTFTIDDGTVNQENSEHYRHWEESVNRKSNMHKKMYEIAKAASAEMAVKSYRSYLEGDPIKLRCVIRHHLYTKDYVFVMSNKDIIEIEIERETIRLGILLVLLMGVIKDNSDTDDTEA